jgi:3-oxoadipate enol-lactonase
LVIAGDDDQIAPVVGMRRMAEAISGARLAIIAGAGHLSSLEQPRAVNQVLREFLAELA